jgi:hypothetical protein
LLPGEETVSTWVNPTQSERNWRSTIVMAYHSSPHLAFQLTNRFKNLDAVSKEVNRLVHSNPVAFVDIPDAAQVGLMYSIYNIMVMTKSLTCITSEVIFPPLQCSSLQEKRQ